METTSNSTELEILPDLCQHVQHAISDMEFYNDEMKFFRNLLDKYLQPLADKDSIARLQETGKLLSELESQKESVRIVLKGFMLKADDALQQPSLMTDEQLTDLYLEIREQQGAFIRSFRRFKKGLFAIMEHLLQTERLQSLLCD